MDNELATSYNELTTSECGHKNLPDRTTGGRFEIDPSQSQFLHLRGQSYSSEDLPSSKIDCKLPVIAPNIKRSLTPDPKQLLLNTDCNTPKPPGCSLISALELGVKVQAQNSNLLLLDTRPFAEYSKAFIRDAIHVCLPTTLLRRKTFTFEKFVDSLPPLEKSMFQEKFSLKKNVDIVIYDGKPNQNNQSVSLPCYGVATKVLDYLTAHKSKHTPCTEISVSILASGFSQYRAIHKEHITDYQQLSTEFNLSNDPDQNLMGISKPEKLAINTESISQSSIPMSPKTNDDNHSSASPISILNKFQLPSKAVDEKPRFMIPKNEEILDLDNYISAVNNKEERDEKVLEDITSSQEALQTFEFPKRNKADSIISTPHHRNGIEGFKNGVKPLRIQSEFYKLVNQYGSENVDNVIPMWFQNLIKRPKLELISQYQKLDHLERKRLNRSLTHKVSRSEIYTSRHKTRFSRSSGSSGLLTKFPELEKYGDSPLNFSESLQIFESSSTPKRTQRYSISTRSTSSCKYHGTKELSDSQSDIVSNSWSCSLDSDDGDDDEVVISSGLELGTKNRFKDIFPYEHSRVRLRKWSSSSNPVVPKGFVSSHPWVEEDTAQNYINASYLNLPPVCSNDISRVKTYISQKVRYIATQAPMTTTIYDFYTCVINNNVPLILSLTNEFENGLETCYQFWQPGVYDDIEIKLIEETYLQNSNDGIVSMISSSSAEDTCLRRIQISYVDVDVSSDKRTYEVLQLQIRKWPDMGTLNNPDEIIQAIILKDVVIENLMPLLGKDHLPTILVHCSAGCGRTGTWCTIDSVLSNLNALENSMEGNLDKEEGKKILYDPISWTINTFRKQRISIVQNINQFFFIYESLLRFFVLELNKELQDRNNEHALFSQIMHLTTLNHFIDSKRKELSTVTFKRL